MCVCSEYCRNLNNLNPSVQAERGLVLKRADLPILHIRGHRSWPGSAQVEGRGLAGTAHDIIIAQPSALDGMFIKLIWRNWTLAHLPEPPPHPWFNPYFAEVPSFTSKAGCTLCGCFPDAAGAAHNDVRARGCTPAGGFRRNSTALISNIWEMSRKWGYN